ncbi:hypothetical protein ANME2D_02890 [Candidatus Methanoperedens nitroreducens]|uniref:Uncharacterized protein n=2 Tax=Candidatus Methanoperedens nitratireducens TaxID=1392998 RepID=A0A062V651_9EURY|nr:hypothetical protein ANME2D_02890 [Candidatus Methanoperedens nitroreducens]
MQSMSIILILTIAIICLLPEAQAHSPLVPEVAVTITLATVQILLGAAVLRLVLKSKEKINIRKRAYLAILGLIALFAWAGLLVGPVLAMLASVLPANGGSSG